jgi:hypothetical protein
VQKNSLFDRTSTTDPNQAIYDPDAPPPPASASPASIAVDLFTCLLCSKAYNYESDVTTHLQLRHRTELDAVMQEIADDERKQRRMVCDVCAILCTLFVHLLD